MANTTHFSLPRERLIDMIAACPTFRTVVGAVTSAQAVEHILSPYSDDEELALDDPDYPAGNEYDPEHVDYNPNLPKPIRDPRPRTIINHFDFSRSKLGSAFGGTKGRLILTFEFMPVTPAPPTVYSANEELAAFEEQIGNILGEIEARSGQDKVAGEGVFTGDTTTHLNVTEITLFGGPASSYQEEQTGELFYGAIFIVEYT